MVVLNKLKPTASWAALAASILLIVFQTMTRGAAEQGAQEAEHKAIVEKINVLEQDTVRRREMDDLKNTVDRMDNKLDRILENQANAPLSSEDRTVRTRRK